MEDFEPVSEDEPSINTNYTTLAGVPVKLALSFLAPMILLQLFGVPSPAKLIEESVLPTNRTLGVARIGLAPILIYDEKKSTSEVLWSELLLLSHSAPDARDILVLGSGDNIVAVSAGAIEPRPNLEHATTADPRTKPLFRVKLPRKKLLAAAVHLQSDPSKEEQSGKYWVIDGKAEALFSRDSQTLVTMTENEYVALILIFSVATVLFSVGGILVLRTPKLTFPSSE